MWNKRREESYPPSPATPPTSAQLAREGIPMSTIPARSVEAEGPRGSALIGKSVILKGQICSREDLYVDGEIEGTVELQEQKLTIGHHGKIQANVKAREVVVNGTVHGNIEATDKVDIRKDAKLIGDIRTARIVIEDGAYFKGSIDISRPEVGKPAAAPRSQQPAAGTSPQQQALPGGPAAAK